MSYASKKKELATKASEVKKVGQEIYKKPKPKVGNDMTNK